MNNFRETLASNDTDLFIAEEVRAGVVPDGAIWRRGEPNSYTDFGSEQKTAVRKPINANRRQKKGTPVGLSAKAGYEADFTYANLQEDLQGFFFSTMRRKSEIVATGVAADGYTVGNGGAAYVAGTLLFAKGGALKANDGLKLVGAGSTGNKIAVAGLAVSAAPVTVSRVGYQAAGGDIGMAIVNGFPTLTSVAFDFTTLGVTPGEFVYVGGDNVNTAFATDVCNGWARVYSVAAHALAFDKTDFPVIADAGAGKTIRVFIGRTIRDEDSALQFARSYSLRRNLGRPDLDDLSIVQGEIVSGCVASVLTLSIPEEDKISATLEYIGRDHTQYSDEAAEAAAGNWKVVEAIEADAINSTRDSVRARMAVYEDGVSAPVPLFPIFSDFELKIDNKLSENKAVTRFGSVSVTPGTFEVTASFNGYFARVEGVKAVRNNDDVTFDFAMFKGNQGVVIDFPLLSLSTDGPQVESDTPITISVDAQAAGGEKYNPAMSHTALITFFDYVPDRAATTI